MKRNALYRRGFRAALRPTALAALVAIATVPLAAPALDAAAGANDSQALERACERDAGSVCGSLVVDGRARAYRLHVPPRPAERPALLVVLHGGGGDAAWADRVYGASFGPLAEASGALVAYPDGYGRHWNDGRGDLPARTVRENVDDVRFLESLVAELVRRHRVDPARVYVAGMSNGGMMSLRLACESAHTFAGFVVVAGNLGVELADRCRPSRVVRLALVAGTDDPLVPWNGGDVSAFGRARGRVLSTRDTWATFTRAAGCTGERAGPPVDRVPDDATALVLHRATGCRADADLRLYEIRGGGHAWPGDGRAERPRLTGRKSRELDVAAEAWRFLGLDRVAR